MSIELHYSDHQDDLEADLLHEEEGIHHLRRDYAGLLSEAQMLQPSVEISIDVELGSRFELDDEGYGEATASPTPSLITLDSSVREGVVENGRLYPSYGQHVYGLPIDEQEQRRMDVQHTKHKLILGRLYLAPIGPTPHRILDLATGTGSWAIEVADQRPSAQVIGVDIAPIAPLLVPPNCSFEIEDIEQTWSWTKDSFDFVHIREPLFCIRDWNDLLKQVYTHLKPGGWFEVACTHMRPMTKDPSAVATSEFTRTCETLMQASESFGVTSEFVPRLSTFLRDAGFCNVVENIFEVPTTPYSATKLEQMIGTTELLNLDMATPSMGLRIMERTLGWTQEQTEAHMRSFKKSARQMRRGTYFNYFVVYGQKPFGDIVD